MSSPIDLSLLQRWVGNTETSQDTITLAPVRSMSALLDRDDAAPQVGDGLPPLWHWMYFLPAAKQSDLDEDGHAKRGGFLPPVPLPRRMWAGGQLEFFRPIHLGDPLRRTSTIQSVKHKQGKSGDLVFVTVEHRYDDKHGPCLREVHDIVYRPFAHATDTAVSPISAATLIDASPHAQPLWLREITPNETMLFRYSALTFNAHRIHYDRKYASEVEAYSGLVVHGPLIATLLVDLLRRHTDRPLKRFTFKAVRPTFECADQRRMRVNAQLHSDGQHCHLWAQDHEGWLTMQADAELGVAP
jgi:3-methylfumaryl-CoA hydratase